MKQNNIYIAVMLAVYLSLAVVFDFFPRSRYSELEKRELASFPTFTADSLMTGKYTTAINSWFSDTEPYRDIFMSVSMTQKDLLSIAPTDDAVTFHASASPATETENEEEDDADGMDEELSERNVGKLADSPLADENAKIANKGIIIVGKGDKVRALMAYGGGPNGGVAYAQAANEYKKAFGKNVNVYCMVIPTAVDYYCPEKARKCSNEERLTINNIHAHLAPDVHAVDVYTILGKHAGEDIFLRTDHHWAPLGAYYAAQQFAKVAKVPFRTLESYTRKVVRGFVGSMYGYSGDISLKRAPEDFVYYVPNGIDYTTTYTDYKLNDDYQIVAECKPVNGPFFYKFKDGNGGAYCTFMGSDMRIVKVRTGTRNSRRLMILKDSFGNALPGYLFYSFEEINVVDYRYFTKNMRDFVKANAITDILFANNIFNAYSKKICSRYMRFLTQVNGSFPSASVKPQRADSTARKHKEESAAGKAEAAVESKPEAVDSILSEN